MKLSDDIILKIRGVEFRGRALNSLIQKMTAEFMKLKVQNLKDQSEISEEIAKKHNIDLGANWFVDDKGDLVFDEKVPQGEKVS